jgi:hypothetical protein
MNQYEHYRCRTVPYLLYYHKTTYELQYKCIYCPSYKKIIIHVNNPRGLKETLLTSVAWIHFLLLIENGIFQIPGIHGTVAICMHELL